MRTPNLTPLVNPGSENHPVNSSIAGLNLRIKAVCPAGHAHHAMGWLPTATQHGHSRTSQVIRERAGVRGRNRWGRVEWYSNGQGG